MVFLLGAAHAQTTAALPAPPPRPAVVDARLGVHPDKTRFVLELSDAVAFKVSTTAAPYRVIVDLPDLVWPGGDAPAAGRGLVQRYQRMAGDSGGLRVVFETSGPVQVREAYMLPPKDGHKPRFVLDLAPTTPDAFAKSVQPAAQPAAKPAVVRPEPAPAAIPAPLPPARVVPVALPAAPPAPSPPRGPEKPLIVLDPGHGGEDPGAVGVGGVFEKDITLAVARELRRQLEATGRYRVMLTRDKDVFIRLRERVGMARDVGADLFLSLHADSIATGSIRGLSIYTLSDKASDREAEMLAAKENRADAIAGLDLSGENDLVASILIDLAQRDTMNHSKRFAKAVLESVRHDITLLPSKPHRQAGFAVLTAPDVPSVLVEMGYLSSPQDANQLKSPQHRERLARGVTRAVDSYFKWLGGPQKL
ncbi:N-acetylmuramoyl-L-alanine amidase [Azospirillum sp. TSO22-1]|uniref:N-acetylmuramoyl-L-alanine amidase n=1 Tax=Azospirillum sp. TSO22-1 TaxID=716789 RepID=UPI001FFF2000|nr:N-acetylmuramoyl-L-alanine amidase [Azospirillum sp. TSO22-1]